MLQSQIHYDHVYKTEFILIWLFFSFNYVYDLNYIDLLLTEKTNHVTHPSDINIAHTNVQYITISKILTEILAHSTPFL